jgi:hypothetical protein
MSVPAVSVAGVKQVVKVRMLPTSEQAASLRATLGTCNAAASWLSAALHEQRVGGKFEAQRRFYTELKSRFGLSAQPAIRVIGKVADAYATLKANIDAGIVAEAQRTGRGIAVEQLTGIRARVRPIRPSTLGWRSSKSTRPTRRRRVMHAAGWTNVTATRRATLSVAGVASLGTPTTTQQSTSPPAVSNAGAKSCAHTQRPP